MSEWWTYRVGDFLMFSPRTYYRMFEVYNRDVWPLHVLMAAVAAWCFFRRSTWLLAVIWVWVGWAFLWARYREIFWVAGWVAGLFVVQAVLMGVLRTPPGSAAPHRALFVMGMVVQPVVGLVHRSWEQVEVFGIAPDPTVTVTLAFLIGGRARGVLLIIPMIWVVISGATAWAMNSIADALVALVILCVSLFRGGGGTSPVVSPEHDPAVLP